MDVLGDLTRELVRSIQENVALRRIVSDDTWTSGSISQVSGYASPRYSPITSESESNSPSYSPVGEPAAEADRVVPEYTELQSTPAASIPMPRYFDLSTINTDTLATYGVHIERANPLQEDRDEQSIADEMRRRYEEEEARNDVPSRAYEMVPSDDEENNAPPPYCTMCLNRFPKYMFKECGHAGKCLTCTKRNEYRSTVEKGKDANICDICNVKRTMLRLYL